jgi:hypothetical protein
MEKAAALTSVETTKEATRARYRNDKSSKQSTVQCGLAISFIPHDISLYIWRV